MGRYCVYKWGAVRGNEKGLRCHWVGNMGLWFISNGLCLIIFLVWTIGLWTLNGLTMITKKEIN